MLPLIRSIRSLATSAVYGLPCASPSNSKTESQPITSAPSASGSEATASALARASSRAVSCGSVTP